MASCAQIVPPTGGEKDTTPPTLLSSVPENYSTQFNSKTIVLEFDEYVSLKDISNQLIISPPMQEKPVFKLKGKMLYIELKEALQPNTTYNLNFGNSVADITEGNLAGELQYVFSTGTFLDSLTWSGKVKNAFNNAPEGDVLVMLYETLEDSIPLKERPNYFAKTRKDGTFSIHHIKAGKYKLFALKDGNFNYLFDLANEAIAFSLEAIDPGVKDTVQPKPLGLFVEDNEVQYVKKVAFNAPGSLTVVFNKPTENPNITALNHTFKKDWFIKELLPNKDTLLYWLTGVGGIDTLLLEVKDGATVIDTLQVNIVTDNDKQKKLSGSNNGSGVFNPNDSLWLVFSSPIKNFDTSHIQLFKDTIQLPVQIVSTDKALRRYAIAFPWEEKTTYKLQALPNAFTDIYNRTHDTLNINLTTRKLRYYGSFKMTLHFEGSNNILQLLNDKGQVVQENMVSSGNTIHYHLLDPGTYAMKLIFDDNNNGKWDTGNYLEGIQPEKTTFFQDKITVRSSWEFELDWTIK